jgi:Leucine-rich repeat (LRR) protein
MHRTGSRSYGVCMCASGCERLTLLPVSIGDLSRLRELHMIGCRSLTSLPESLGRLSKLTLLDLTSCEGLVSLPASIGDLLALEARLPLHTS